MSVPKAVLSEYFFARRYVLSIPFSTSSNLARSDDPGGNTSAISGGNGCVLSQIFFSAISFAVASSMRWPCSMHFQFSCDLPGENTANSITYSLQIGQNVTNQSSDSSAAHAQKALVPIGEK